MRTIIFCIPGFTKFTMEIQISGSLESTISSWRSHLEVFFKTPHKYGRSNVWWIWPFSPFFSGEIHHVYHLGVAPWELLASEGAGVGEGFKVLVSSLATKTSRNL